MKNEPTHTTLSAELEKEAAKVVEAMRINTTVDFVRGHDVRLFIQTLTEFALSPIAQRIAREGWMPVQWNSPDNPPIQRNKKHNSSGDILLLGKGGWIGIGCYYFGLKKFDSDHIIGWMYLPSPNAPEGKGYISVEESDEKAILFAMSVCGNSADRGHFEYLLTQFKSNQKGGE